MRFTLLIAACAFLTACPRPVSPSPDASDAQVPDQDAATAADLCAGMCKHLRDLTCPEGSPAGTTCELLCTQVQGEHTFNLKPRCVMAAKTVEEVRACGTVECRQAASK